MSIKGNIGQGVVDLDTTDIVVLNFSSRVAVTSLSIYNGAGAARVVDFYESPNLTSASGKKIATHSLDSAASADVDEIIGQGYSSSQNIIAVVDTGSLGDINAKLTYIQYTGSS